MTPYWKKQPFHRQKEGIFKIVSIYSGVVAKFRISQARWTPKRQDAVSLQTLRILIGHPDDVRWRVEVKSSQCFMHESGTWEAHARCSKQDKDREPCTRLGPAWLCLLTWVGSSHPGAIPGCQIPSQSPGAQSGAAGCGLGLLLPLLLYSVDSAE